VFGSDVQFIFFFLSCFGFKVFKFAGKNKEVAIFVGVDTMIGVHHIPLETRQLLGFTYLVFIFYKAMIHVTPVTPSKLLIVLVIMHLNIVYVYVQHDIHE
jgi:hypothetical protein